MKVPDNQLGCRIVGESDHVNQIFPECGLKQIPVELIHNVQQTRCVPLPLVGRG
jgi:hypothetical protein